MKKILLILLLIPSLIFALKSPYHSLDTKDYEQVREELNNPLKLYNYIDKNFTYVKDTVFSNTDYWQNGKDMFYRGWGDCMDINEQVYCKNGIKKFSELNIGDEILSYNFEKQIYEYKKITKIWDSEKNAIEISFRNGTKTIMSKEHRLFSRSKIKGKIVYIPKEVYKIKINCGPNRKIACAVKIPYKEKDIEWLSEDLCFLLGFYWAEGWNEKKRIRIRIGSYDVYSIIPILNKYNIKYSLNDYKTKKRVPIITIYTNQEIIKYFSGTKSNSFDIHPYKELYDLPIKKLQKILDGEFLGDGHNQIKKNRKIYNTSSDELSEFIKIASYRIGSPVNFYYQINHQGAGKKPIWRIYDNKKSIFRINRGVKDLSDVCIKKIVDLKKIIKMRDIEVEDNHNFVVVSSGIISHNCDDYATFCLDILKYHGFETYWVAGKWISSGHAITLFKWKGKWHAIGNTHLKYNDMGKESLDIVKASSNAGFSTIWWIYEDSVPSVKLKYDQLEQKSAKYISVDRVDPQLYVSSTKFYGNQNNYFDIRINPFWDEKNKASFSYMRKISKSLSVGLGYSIHGFYLGFNNMDLNYMNHLVWVHTLLFGRIGISGYVDINQNVPKMQRYGGVDVDFKVFDFTTRALGFPSQFQGFIAFRNMFEIIDADLRAYFSRNFYVYFMKRDKHYMAKGFYEFFRREKIKDKDGNTPDISKFINMGVFLDSDYNVGVFLNSQPFEMTFGIRNIDIDKFDNIINTLNTMRFDLQMKVRL